MEEQCDCDEWTLEKILNEIASNLGSLQGIYEVRWLDNPQSEPSGSLVRITPWEGQGKVIRLAIKTSFNDCEKESFDKRFEGS